MDAVKPRCSQTAFEYHEHKELNMGIALSKCGDKEIAIMFCGDCGVIFSTQIISQLVEKPRVELITGGMTQ